MSSLISPRGRVAASIATAAFAGAGLVAQASAADAATAQYAQYSTPGTYSWTVPTGVTSVTVDAYGAQGGSGFAEWGFGTGGKGAVVHAELHVTPGQVLTFVVGGQSKPVVDGENSRAGGFGGGGEGGF